MSEENKVINKDSSSFASKPKETTRSKIKNAAISSYDNRFSILKLVFLCLLGVACFRVLTGKPIPTFTSLLDLLSGSFTVNFPLDWFSNWGDWGIFNFIKEIFMNVCTILVFLGTGIINLINFFFVFIKWIFI